MIDDPESFRLVPLIPPESQDGRTAPKPRRPRKPPESETARWLRARERERRREAKVTVSVICPGCGSWNPGPRWNKGPRNERCPDWRCRCPLPWPDLPPVPQARVQAELTAFLEARGKPR